VAVLDHSSRLAATPTVQGTFRTIRGVYSYKAILSSVQTALDGGAGITVTDTDGATVEHVISPAGMWTNPKTNKPC
jgi:hypothetical protein